MRPRSRTSRSPRLLLNLSSASPRPQSRHLPCPYPCFGLPVLVLVLGIVLFLALVASSRSTNRYSGRQLQGIRHDRWQSVRELRISYGYKSLIEIFALAKKKFQDGLLGHHNTIVRRITPH